MGVFLNPRAECRGLETAREGTAKVRLKHEYIFEPTCGVPGA